MSLIQPLKFRTWEMGHFKMPRFDMPRLQMAVFQTVITVASGLSFAVSVGKGLKLAFLLENCYLFLFVSRIFMCPTRFWCVQNFKCSRRL